MLAAIQPILGADTHASNCTVKYSTVSTISLNCLPNSLFPPFDATPVQPELIIINDKYQTENDTQSCWRLDYSVMLSCVDW
jgi:hypothetical protein